MASKGKGKGKKVSVPSAPSASATTDASQSDTKRKGGSSVANIVMPATGTGGKVSDYFAEVGAAPTSAPPAVLTQRAKVVPDRSALQSPVAQRNTNHGHSHSHGDNGHSHDDHAHDHGGHSDHGKHLPDIPFVGPLTSLTDELVCIDVIGHSHGNEPRKPRPPPIDPASAPRLPLVPIVIIILSALYTMLYLCWPKETQWLPPIDHTYCKTFSCACIRSINYPFLVVTRC
jgi:hypothetical protein